jgi:hypothetical protein
LLATRARSVEQTIQAQHVSLLLPIQPLAVFVSVSTIRRSL